MSSTLLPFIIIDITPSNIMYTEYARKNEQFTEDTLGKWDETRNSG